MKKVDYNIYSTLLNTYQNYVDAETLWSKFWGSSDDPQITVEDYCEKTRKELIDTINRVPFDSEAADKGTAFNEVIDCLIEHRQSNKMEIVSDKNTDTIKVNYNDRTFYFPLVFCVSFAGRYEFAISQHYTEGILDTSLGRVKLYGYTDEITPFRIVDIKTTSKYEAFKFRKTWQHKVYPFCLSSEGMLFDAFRYDVVVFGKDAPKVYEEDYTYVPERDIPELIEVCEGFINFLNVYKSEITDLKIFNNH